MRTDRLLQGKTPQMRLSIIKIIFSALFLGSLLMSGCNGGPGGGPAEPYSVAIGGTVTGLAGSVVLQDNGGDNLIVPADGNFTFVTLVRDGSPYNVTVLTQPLGQTCIVSNGTGTARHTMEGGWSAHVAVACSNNSYTVGGSVTGLNGTVLLQDNNGDDLTVAANGLFTFATPVQHGTTYNVTILTQPLGQTCTVSTGAGTISGGNVTNVAVVCSTNAYSVGGTVSGLTGTLVLQDNHGDDLTVVADGVFTFATHVADSSPYSVTVLTQPTGLNPMQPSNLNCSVAGGAGTIAGADVTTVAITCAINTYTIGGTVSGLTGTMVMQNNNGDDLNIASNGTFTFATTVAYGNTYNVTLLSLYSDQTYTIIRGSGMVMANVTGVTVNVLSCAAGFAHCDYTASVLNGCETNTQTDPNNCGSCGAICATSCVAGVCTPPPCASDADCPGAGATCSGGVCIAGCSAAADCPGTDTACQTRTCSAGTCGFSNMAAGTACDDASACTTNDVCNGSGACLGGPSATCDDGNACTTDACNAALGCTYTPLASGACDDGNVCTVSDACSSGICTGNSVADGTGCGSGKTCQSGVCQLLTQGSACSANNQCDTGICVDGVCCDTVCATTCQACIIAYTGQASGTCAYISVGTDPGFECGATSCNGAGACI